MSDKYAGSQTIEAILEIMDTEFNSLENNIKSDFKNHVSSIENTINNLNNDLDELANRAANNS